MSAILSDADLNDFISPGLACIKPAGEVRANKGNGDTSNYEIQIGSNGEALEVSIDDGTVKDLPSASISLQDCLACSGCITSAEEVLLAKQTHTILLEELSKNNDEKIFAMSVSHQARVSLSTYLNIPIVKVDELLMNVFSEKYGFKFVVGTELGRVLSITKTNNELIQRKINGNLNKTELSCICPGFVLYVEKTKPEILPYLLNVKSPQQITGLLLKNLISRQMNIPSDKIYHLSIMPCFDKKLEAARPENSDDFIDVDCVITPKELIELFKAENINILEYMTNSTSAPISLYNQAAPQHWPYPIESWDSNFGSSSGGYAQNYIIALQDYYTTQKQIETNIKEIKGKNSDVVEYQLLDPQGVKLGSSAIVNGFRNIQNLVRKLKPSGRVKVGSGNALTARRRARMRGNGDDSTNEELAIADPASCDYVEVMACPGGCINGGGLNGPIETTIANTKEFLSTMINKYENELKQINELKDFKRVEGFMEEFKREFGIEDKRIFQYKLNVIEKQENVLTTGNNW